jgi:hypothetical protein
LTLAAIAGATNLLPTASISLNLLRVGDGFVPNA